MILDIEVVVVVVMDIDEVALVEDKFSERVIGQHPRVRGGVLRRGSAKTKEYA